MQFSLIGGGNKDENTKSGKVYYGSLYDFWWGNSPQESLLQSIDDSDGRFASKPLYHVMYSSNYFYHFASVISFGLVVPIDVRWTLISDEPKEYIGPVRKKNEQ